MTLQTLGLPRSTESLSGRLIPPSPRCDTSVLSISESPIHDLQSLNTVTSPDHRHLFRYARKPALLSIALGSSFTAARHPVALHRAAAFGKGQYDGLPFWALPSATTLCEVEF